MPIMTSPVVLQTVGITKRFGPITANDHIDFTLRKGEIHALLGENGAGKSTLMRMIAGLSKPDSGDIIIRDRQVAFQTPNDAIGLGIHMVHQHFMLVPVFTVAENIILGNETTWRTQTNVSNAEKNIHQFAAEYNLDIDPNAVVETLPVGMQQRVEIIKALTRNVDILILDEPTAVLTPGEAEDLFQIMQRLTEKGVSIIFITHKLREVMAVAQRISILRQGRLIETLGAEQTNESHLATLMVGKNVKLHASKSGVHPGQTVLRIDHLNVTNEQRVNVVCDVNLQVRAGEIIGIAGVQGNGQTELAAALTGLGPATNGTIRLKDTLLPKLDPRARIKLGMGHIPEDRLKHGLVLPYSIADNHILCTYNKAPFVRYMHRNWKAILANCKRLISAFDIRTTGPHEPVASLSGGNQQKVILSRELSRDICFLLANQPTRGLDVGSIAYIHQKIIELRDKGVAILLISSELDEILTLADSIVVMYKGRLTGMLAKDDAKREHIGMLMAGAAV